MTSWSDFEREAPDLARFARDRIERHGLALLATLARDGSPRISGIEPILDGREVWLGMMTGSVKGADLRRDPRLALHNATVDKDVAEGDVKISGRAVPDRGPGAPDVGAEADLFRLDLTGVSSLRVGDGELIIETWRPGQGVTVRRRR